MAMLLETVCVLPTIASVCTTYAGDPYTVLTPEYTDIVTVNGSYITCTCQSGHCAQSAQAAAHQAISPSGFALWQVMHVLNTAISARSSFRMSNACAIYRNQRERATEKAGRRSHR
jgi:hypothetical protein